VTGDPYAAIASLYDLEHAGFADDLDLYRSLARVVGDPILELGCGTGRLLVPLAAAGHHLTGLDASAPMLERAAIAAADAGVASRVTLRQGTMAEADHAPGGPFGLVIVALNGLLHLPTAAEQRAALVAARRALDPRGQLVLDLLNPTPEALQGLDHGLAHEGSWRLADGSRVDKFSTRRLRPVEQRIDVDLWYDQITPDGTVRRTVTNFTLRYLHAAELELMLELAGFAEWQLYGSYDLDPYDETAERLIVTAEVTPSE
jgi:SAM-dependent methyltransferase